MTESDRCEGAAATCTIPPCYVFEELPEAQRQGLVRGQWQIRVCRDHVVAALDVYLLDPPGGFDRLGCLVVSVLGAE